MGRQSAGRARRQLAAEVPHCTGESWTRESTVVRPFNLSESNSRSPRAGSPQPMRSRSPRRSQSPGASPCEPPSPLASKPSIVEHFVEQATRAGELPLERLQEWSKAHVLAAAEVQSE